MGRYINIYVFYKNVIWKLKKNTYIYANSYIRRVELSFKNLK